MTDQKLTALKHFIDAASESPQIHMWFIVPGGFFAGRPITIQQHYATLGITELEATTLDEQDRFFFFEKVTFVSGVFKETLETAMVDGSEVVAWGFTKAPDQPKSIIPW